MQETFGRKKKILNDPVYGFININDELIFDIIEHPWFQRLRRIKQLGLTHLVYPGALHTRFHHSIGAMHLMQKALEILSSKGHMFSKDERLATLIAILLHDIGHGPYSHSLEKKIVEELSHEELTLLFLERLKRQFGEIFDLAIKIFSGDCSKSFLHQLVSSQLDTDRLDFLKRDSYFTGVAEGVINSDRIITMMEVVSNNLVIEAKGIYSIENFIVARRLMYWQVYLHKTVLSAEQMLLQVIRRAKFLFADGNDLFGTATLKLFMKNRFTKNDFLSNPLLLNSFGTLDDFDVFTAIKEWAKCDDHVLSLLCQSLVKRNLFRTEIKNKPITEEEIEFRKESVISYYDLSPDEVNYFVLSGSAQNSAYDHTHEGINILFKDGQLLDIAEVSDQLTTEVLSKTVKKYFICYPKAPFDTN